jgi:hypothetical protein
LARRDGIYVILLSLAYTLPALRSYSSGKEGPESSSPSSISQFDADILIHSADCSAVVGFPPHPSSIIINLLAAAHLFDRFGVWITDNMGRGCGGRVRSVGKIGVPCCPACPSFSVRHPSSVTVSTKGWIFITVGQLDQFLY